MKEKTTQREMEESLQKELDAQRQKVEQHEAKEVENMEEEHKTFTFTSTYSTTVADARNHAAAQAARNQVKQFKFPPKQ